MDLAFSKEEMAFREEVRAFFRDNVLLDQPFVKDESKTIQSLLDEVGAKTGEKVAVRRFTRYRLGEDLE